MAETLTTLTKLFVVQEIQEDEGGAILQFQQGAQGRLDARDPSYAARLRLARRSRERQHPVGVCLGEGQVITELLRADHDVPAQVLEEDTEHARLLFQGHDGVFRLISEHAESERIRAVLDQTLQNKAPVWFIAQKPDMTILDVLAAEPALTEPQSSQGIPMELTVSFVVAPDHLLRTADEILRSRIRCTSALRRDIRAVAKAYIDEADELSRAVREIECNAPRIQIESLSPRNTIEKAKKLETVRLTNTELQERVRAVARSYVLLAEKNLQLFEKFKEQLRNQLPPAK